MIKRSSFILYVSLILISPVSIAQQSTDDLIDGQVMTQGHMLVAWHAGTESWVSIEQFWLNYTAANGGLTWGQSDQYPPYAQVKEYDTFMVEVPEGMCLMEFFHSRWRRANDVRRWDDAFNGYAGCPTVFD